MMALAVNPMLTLVSVPCAQCGSTRETMRLDREVLEDARAVCCEIPTIECRYCGNLTAEPYWSGKRPFCCYGCCAGWAE
jgi:hypothetical protein